MKKILLPLLLILAVGMLAAVESEPSEVVGYFKINIPVGVWTPVSIPFQIIDGTVLNIFGGNWACNDDYSIADEIIDAYNGNVTYYYTGYDWDNTDPSFTQPGHVYWIHRTQPQSDTNMFLLGKVSPQIFTLTMAGQDLGGWSPFAINDAAAVDPSSLNFTVTEPDWNTGAIDKIICTNDGRIAEYWGAEYGGWNSLDGLPFLIEPAKAYNFYSNQNSSWNWTYNPLPTKSIFNSQIKKVK